MTNCSAVELIYSGEIEKLCLFQKEMKQRRIRYSNYLNEILYLIFDYPHKHYTFKYFEV